MDNEDITQEEAVEIPEATLAAMNDPGWYAAALYINEVGNQVFGGNAMIVAIPDPEGFHQIQAGKPGGRPGIFVEVQSLAVQGLAASLVVPFEMESFVDIRLVMAEMFTRLRDAEIQKTTPSLLVPEKKLIIPGQD